MGNFYVNYTLKPASQSSVASLMQGRKAIICPPVNDVVVVFDEASDSQDEKIISSLAERLSANLKCAVLALMNHDDDILWYRLYSAGNKIDEYNSCPDYFEFGGDGEPRGPTGGDAKKLRKVFGNGDAEEIERILRAPMEDYAFAIERHLDLCKALGLPIYVAGTAYASFEQGEIPEGISEDEIVRTK